MCKQTALRRGISGSALDGPGVLWKVQSALDWTAQAPPTPFTFFHHRPESQSRHLHPHTLLPHFAPLPHTSFHLLPLPPVLQPPHRFLEKISVGTKVAENAASVGTLDKTSLHQEQPNRGSSVSKMPPLRLTTKTGSHPPHYLELWPDTADMIASIAAVTEHHTFSISFFPAHFAASIQNGLGPGYAALQC